MKRRVETKSMKTSERNRDASDNAVAFRVANSLGILCYEYGAARVLPEIKRLIAEYEADTA